MPTSATPYYQQAAHAQPVVVKGAYVPSSNYQQQQQSQQFSGSHASQPLTAASPYAHVTSATDLKPDAPATRSCRDMVWAILFYIHIAVILGLSVTFLPQMIGDVAENVGGRLLRGLQDEDGNNGDADLDLDIKGLMVALCISTVLALVLSTLALGFMITFAEALIKMALIFNVIFFGLLAALSFLSGAIGGALVLLLFCGFSAYYAYRVWARIPFAAANLVTAVTAVRANMGLAFYAYLSMFLLFAWSIFWSVSFMSTNYVLGNCNTDFECENEINPFFVFLFFVSYYWTIQVLANVVHCTTSGTVGTWWMVPVEANGCCSPAVRQSYVRSLTTSFGSICLGSLIVAIIQAVKEMIQQAREQDDNFIACCADCLLGLLQSLMEYFNKWAFVYVGLYGFSFMEAGTNVMRLFRERGWTSIITDYMVDTVLFMVSVGVAILVGILALMLGAVQGGDGVTMGTYFVVGLIIGYGMCTTLFSVVSSAVNTVIVCYAEAPNEFQTNHPELSNNMRAAWRKVWPAEFNY